MGWGSNADGGLIMKSLLVLFLSLVLLASMNSCKNAEASEKPSLEVVSVQQMIDVLKAEDVQLIDVRTPEEFTSGHIKGAENVTYDANFSKKLANLDKTKPVAVYCHKGGRSAKSAVLLKGAGFQKIYDLDGGLSSWVQDNRQVVK